jgi:hypothetical protein
MGIESFYSAIPVLRTKLRVRILHHPAPVPVQSGLGGPALSDTAKRLEHVSSVPLSEWNKFPRHVRNITFDQPVSLSGFRVKRTSHLNNV